MATHSSILAWEIPGQRSLAGYTVHGVAKSQTRLKQLSMRARSFRGAHLPQEGAASEVPTSRKKEHRMETKHCTAFDQSLHFCHGSPHTDQGRNRHNHCSPTSRYPCILLKRFSSYLISSSLSHCNIQYNIYIFPERTAILSALPNTFNLNSTCNHS